MNLKALTEKRVALLKQMSDMVDACENRAFNEEEQKKYSELLTEIRSIDASIRALQDTDALKNAPVQPVAEQTAEEKRSQEDLETRAFECYLRGIQPDEETRAATNMTTGDNGAVIPTTIVNKIIEQVKDLSPIYRQATHYNLPGTITIPSYDETTDKITVAYADEFAEQESHIGNFTSISLKGFLIGARTLVSVSLINNSQFAIVPFVIRKMAEAIAEWLDNTLLNGDENIEGLKNAAVGVTAAASDAVTGDELIDLQSSIKDTFQSNCIWIMSPKTRTAIRKLKDNENRYLLNPDLTSTWGFTLLGKPVYVSDYMPDMESGKTAIYYLDPKGLAVKTVEEASVQVLREKYADQHAVGVYCWMEVDSKIEDGQKIRKLVMA